MRWRSRANTVRTIPNPKPYPEPDRIVQLMNVTPQGSFPAASVPKYNVWHAQTQALEDVAAYDNGGPGVRVQVWGKLGEYAAAFKKGAHVCVEGELRSAHGPVNCT